MKIKISFEAPPNIYRLMRDIGYRVHPHVARKGGEVTYIRELGRALYPRFHIYFSNTKNDYEFDIHLDSKKASYEGQIGHSGEYDGEVVEQEVNRIKQVLGIK